MTLKLITAPAEDPVSLAEARLWCRVDDGYTADDADLTMLIQSARVRAEHETGRSFLSTTWEQVFDAFPAVELELAAQPVQSIVSVQYINSAGVLTTLDSAAYVLDDVTSPAFVLPAVGYSWPATLDTINAVRVQFVQGWASASNPLCAPLRQWVRMQVESGYKLRGAHVLGVTVNDVPNRYVDRLLDCYRTWAA